MPSVIVFESKLFYILRSSRGPNTLLFFGRESDITKERIEKILKAGANVVLTTKGIDDMSLKVCFYYSSIIYLFTFFKYDFGYNAQHRSRNYLRNFFAFSGQFLLIFYLVTVSFG